MSVCLIIEVNKDEHRIAARQMSSTGKLDHTDDRRMTQPMISCVAENPCMKSLLDSYI
jgi:hypothetical protein